MVQSSFVAVVAVGRVGSYYKTVVADNTVADSTAAVAEQA